LHDTPWDFWRFSLSAWAALFNPATGFRIIDAASAEPLMMVAQRWHPVVNYGQAGGFALSAVLVEKVGKTRLEWDVDLSGVAVGDYPYKVFSPTLSWCNLRQAATGGFMGVR
jgi:hypothetical protein